MKRSSLCISLGVFLATAFTFPSISCQAETHCPGDIAGLRPRVVAGALLVIPVKVNQSGPFDFMVDTGSQLTVIDPSLASQLGLRPQGMVGLVATASYLNAATAELDTLEAGSHVVEKPLVVIQDLGQIEIADRRIRGVLGENFLAHFDLLIDYPHKLLCLDETRAMQGTIRGERVPMVNSRHPQDELPFTERLVISVRLSDTGTRPILLQLDSGSDGPILYSGNKELEESLLKRATLRGEKASKAQRAFAPLPPQDMRIGNRTMRQIQFVTPVSAARNIPNRDEDGLLPTVLFERVYISHADHYLVFDPR